MENLYRRTFPATCCAYCSASFAWKLLVIHQRKHCFIDDENAPWSSATKSMLHSCLETQNAPLRNATSLADTKHLFIDLWGLEFCIWLRPRVVYVMHARDEIINLLRESKEYHIGLWPWPWKIARITKKIA